MAPSDHNAPNNSPALPPLRDGAERIVISPHRSLGRDGTLVVVSVIGSALALVLTWVAAPAAWFVLVPAVAVFAGLAVAFWLNARRGLRLEIIDISRGSIRVMTSYLGRHEVVAHFDPHWVRIELSDAYKIEKRIILRESGRAVSIGECLSPPEREALTGELRNRIKRARSWQ